MLKDRLRDKRIDKRIDRLKDRLEGRLIDRTARALSNTMYCPKGVHLEDKDLLREIIFSDPKHLIIDSETVAMSIISRDGRCREHRNFIRTCSYIYDDEVQKPEYNEFIKANFMKGLSDGRAGYRMTGMGLCFVLTNLRGDHTRLIKKHITELLAEATKA